MNIDIHINIHLYIIYTYLYNYIIYTYIIHQTFQKPLGKKTSQNTQQKNVSQTLESAGGGSMRHLSWSWACKLAACASNSATSEWVYGDFRRDASASDRWSTVDYVI